MADMRSMAGQERGLRPSYVCFRELGENAIYDTGLECASSLVIIQLIAAVYLAAAVGAGGHSLAKVSLDVQCSEHHLSGLLILAWLQVDDRGCSTIRTGDQASTLTCHMISISPTGALSNLITERRLGL